MSQKKVKQLRKQQKKFIDILIGMPCPQWLAPEVLDNVLGLISYTQNNAPVKLHFAYAKDNRADRSRNKILFEYLKSGHKVDYILWLDADMLYPQDMIVRYLTEKNIDILGCLYFKRGYPTAPIIYMKKRYPDKVRPYWAVDPTLLPQDKIIEVDAVGFGGMMVNTKVYERMGDKMWHHYGPNFHIPIKMEDQASHDIQFCKEAQEFGFKIKIHLGVQAGHISDRVISLDTWMEQRKNQKIVSVIIPATDKDLADKTAKILQQRAGRECEINILYDEEHVGPIHLWNTAVSRKYADYYVYVAQDAFPSRNWLMLALSQLEKERKGLIGFNDGKWRGLMAGFGMVKREFLMQVYQDHEKNPLLFCPHYKQHYADTELTLIAMEMDMYTYNPEAVLMEIDYDKDDKPVNPEDKKLFNKRKETGFDGKVKTERLLNMFG
jgi:hypothetical protein